MALDAADVERIAERIVTLLDDRRDEQPVRYLDPAQLARVLGVDREWVYRHAHRLGAIRLGPGHGRLRFDLKRATDALALAQPKAPRATTPRPATRRSSHRAARVDLLPYES